MLQQRTLLSSLLLIWLSRQGSAQTDSQNELTVSASLSLQRPAAETCEINSDCQLTAACLEEECIDPCHTLPTPCPMEGGLCKVVGHRPVCSCPAGTQNISNICSSDTSCVKEGKKFENGQHYYDESCTQRCECYSGEFICQQTSCEPGLQPKGLLSQETDSLCMERPHPGGDECCVLWVCAEDSVQLENNVCENIVCGSNAVCDASSGTCLCMEGFVGDPNDLDGGCQYPGRQTKEANIALLQITSTSIQVQFPDITGGNLMYVESRFVGRKDPPWENAILVEGNEIFTLTGLNPGTQYTLRWKAPDKQYPDVQVSTAVYDVQKPKIIMTNRSHDSVMLSFDQFRPPGYTNGYVVSWKEEGEEATWSAAEKEPTGDTPSIIIDGLQPNTGYIAKISIYDDYTNRVLGKSTEEIKFQTAIGCSYNSSSYPVGTFFQGCESACECDKSGEVSCEERCQAPLHRKGTFADDDLCVERPVDESNCCVLVVCANAAQDDEDSPCLDNQCGPNAECKHEILSNMEETDTICVCQEGHTGDPDSEEGCSFASATQDTNVSETPEACVSRNGTYSPGEEWFDGCEYKCSCGPKLEILCAPRCKIITENVDSRCELKPDPNDSCCKTMVCPALSDNTNVLQPSLPFDGCVFKNKTYQQEERFYDGCDQQCQCMGFGDLVCLARCPPTTPGLGEDCYTLPDITDNCCNVTICEKPMEVEPDVEKIPEVITTSITELSALGETTTEMTLQITEMSNDILDEKQPRMNVLPEDDGDGVLIGSFINHYHDVQGDLYAFNSSTLVVKGFSYDGSAPDAFFWAGTSDSPSRDGTILPYPFTGQFFEYDENAPVLGRFSDQNLMLHLPPQLNINDIRWLSVWCRQFAINFGDVIWPKNLEFEFENNKDIERQKTDDNEEAGKKEVSGCDYSGKRFAINEEFHDQCNKYCICQTNSEVLCFDIQCPHQFGLDVINPNCIEWENHEDFVATPPVCCPPVPTCKSDGSCFYEGRNFTNYDSIPMDLTGCEKRCHCENEKVSCQNACYEIPKDPPSWLQCPPERAVQLPNPDRECCKIWGCKEPEEPELILPERLLGSSAAPFNESCIAITFEIPPSLSGMKGHYEIGYSAGISGHPDADRWPVHKVIPEEGYIPDEGLIFGEIVEGKALLCQLQPNLEYYLRAAIVLDKTEGSVHGDIVAAKIPLLPPTIIPVEPEVIYLDLELQANDINPTSARVIWKHFDEETEKPYIDGVQLRYLILGDGDIPVSYVPKTSPFIHRDTNHYVFENLDPNTKYEVDVGLIPVPGSDKELYSGRKLIFSTLELIDIYDFFPILEVVNVSFNSAVVSWTGVPSPDQKFVSIYRVIYHSLNPNSIRDESSVFKISKIDSPKRITVESLQADLQYQIWLEAYLTNGKTKKSNVVEFHTLSANPLAQPAVLEEPSSDNSYYSSMVAAVLIAVFAILGLVVVLYFYLRRFTTYKATITKERPPSASPTAAAYDNHGYKGYETNANLNHTTSPDQSFELGQMEGTENGKQIP